MISRRHFIKSAGATALVAGTVSTLSGCADSEQTQDSQLTFVLDYTPNTNHLGLYVAKHLGYYQDEHITVTFLQPPSDGADALVASGGADMGISFQDWMATYLGSDAPLPVTAVAAIIQHNTSGIMSTASKHITRPKNMTSTRYGTLDVASEQAIVKELVEEDGGDFDTVSLVSANTVDEVSGLAADQYDSVWVYEGWGLQNAHLKNFDVNYFSIAQEDPRFDFYTPVIIANNTYLQEHPDTVRAFLAATEKGYTYAAQHPEEAAEILLEEVPELDRDLVYASAQYLSSRFQDGASRWGEFNENRWNAFYTWMNEHTLTDTPIPLSTAFTNNYLPQAKSDDASEEAE